MTLTFTPKLPAIAISLARDQVKRNSRGMGTAAYQYLIASRDLPAGEWSRTLSYTSPESDFVAPDAKSSSSYTVQHGGSKWSGALSFTSPEADFSAEQAKHAVNEKSRQSIHPVDMESLVSHPETSFGLVHSAETMDDKMKAEMLSLHGLAHKPAQTRPDIKFEEFFDNLAMMASPETAAGVVHSASMLDDQSREQLIKIQAQQKGAALPNTLEEALVDPRAIVVTSAMSPFDVVDVNDAWVGLCGYTREEAVHFNLAELLQGPETSIRVATDMISRLKRDHYSEALLTNYTKQGRKFQNRVKIGLLSDENGIAKHCIGVLEEFHDSEGAKVVT